MDSANYKNISEHGVGENKYHLEWCPKYRHDAMRETRVADEMQSILISIAEEKGITVDKIVVDSDHVHLFVELPLWMSVSTALQYLKGISSRKIFLLHPEFREKLFRKGAFWSPGHFSRSVSSITEETVKNYIDKHDHPGLHLENDEDRQDFTSTNLRRSLGLQPEVIHEVSWR